MAQNENYGQVDLRVGTEAQFNAKVDTLPAGTLFGVTDATVSKADLSTDLKNEINGKITQPSNPTEDSAVVINSSGTVSTKPLTSITGKSEVYVGTPDPTGSEILWIDPDGTSGGGGSAGGGQLYSHLIQGNYSSGNTNYNFIFTLYSTISTKMTNEQIYNLTNTCKALCWTRTSTAGSSSQTDYCTHILQTGPSPSWGINQPNNFGYVELKSSTYTDTVTEL